MFSPPERPATLLRQIALALVAAALVSAMLMARLDRFSALATVAPISGALFAVVVRCKRPVLTCAAAIVIGAVFNQLARDLHRTRSYRIGFTFLPGFILGFAAAHAICYWRGWRRRLVVGICVIAALSAVGYLNCAAIAKKVDAWQVRGATTSSPAATAR